MHLKDLTPAQRKRLAALAKTTDGSLRQMQTRRRPSASMALRIERAAKRMGLDIRREDLAAGCDSCEFARACRKLA